MDQSLILVTRKDLPPNNLQEFIAFVRQNQAKLQFGSGGVGGSNHLACVLLNAALGVNVTHVPYRSAGPAMQDMLAGLIDYQCPSAPTVIPQYASNTIKTLAILSKKRSASLPDLPSADEQGLTGFDIPSWYALFLPKGTPDPIVRKLNAAAVAAMNTPVMRERLKAIGSDLAGPERQSPEYLAHFVADEIKKWAGPIRASGVQL
jgi:tripartite-type tricarboxylate transporter receptor subunit TctC